MHIETEPTQHLHRSATAAKQAARTLAKSPTAQRNAALMAMATRLRGAANEILEANGTDVAAFAGTNAFRTDSPSTPPAWKPWPRGWRRSQRCRTQWAAC